MCIVWFLFYHKQGSQGNSTLLTAFYLFIYYLLIILPAEEKLEATIFHGLEEIKLQEMTQADTRSFIPRMLRATTGESPQWGKEACKPLWWPSDIVPPVPFQKIKTDQRRKEEKGKMSWKCALQQITINCYRHYGKEDMVV